jgi:ribosomal protein S20
MSRFSEFFIDLERSELFALERFLERSGSLLTSKSLETSLTALSSALKTMHKSVNDALKQIDKDAQINEVCVAMQLGEDQAAAAARVFKKLTTSELDAMLEDQEASNEVSIALWKILDVIEPASVRL